MFNSDMVKVKLFGDSVHTFEESPGNYVVRYPVTGLTRVSGQRARGQVAGKVTQRHRNDDENRHSLGAKDWGLWDRKGLESDSPSDTWVLPQCSPEVTVSMRSLR